MIFQFPFLRNRNIASLSRKRYDRVFSRYLSKQINLVSYSLALLNLAFICFYPFLLSHALVFYPHHPTPIFTARVLFLPIILIQLNSIPEGTHEVFLSTWSLRNARITFKEFPVGRMENMKPQDKNVFGEGHRKAGPVSKATEPGQTQADVPYYQPLVILSKLSTGLHDPCRSCLPFVYKYKLTPKNVI